ncbi:hypothetical protein OAB49_02460, partial [Gammaproteobacteria bacterium]|nr:hypothetical protein [Gammaproteobacteria bacterium]
MKLINRSSNTKSIDWFSTEESHSQVESVVKRFKTLILSKGTSGLNLINKELSLDIPKSYKVSLREIANSDQAVSDELKSSILVASKNI